ncbi:MAG: XRE family transcriptional regulator [Mesorhizobium sp.]|nr:MAG: XRE family transcriptional regulator [Mesorhizobium sp.]
MIQRLDRSAWLARGPRSSLRQTGLSQSSVRQSHVSADTEKEISASLRRVRDKRKIPRSKFAPMLGLSEPVYVRYERAVSKLTVGRLLHICELLDVSPLEILFPAAPHLWGDNQAEAEQRNAIIERLEDFDELTLTAINDFLQHLKTKDCDRGSAR